MPSSSRPYQSKLLRFVLNQWQRGLERQNRVWRQLQSTATWSAQIAIFPIYAILRAVERARFSLGSGTQQSERPAKSISTAAEPAMRAKKHATDLDHSLTAILSHTQQILSLEQKEQLAIAPKSTIIRQAKSFLITFVNQIRQQLFNDLQPASDGSAMAAAKSPARHLATIHRLQQSKPLATGQAADMNQRAASDLAQNGTTLASSIQTRKLVLVNLKNEVFDIFTPEQQSDLQHYIAQIMQAYRQSRMIVPHRPKRLSIKTILAIAGVFIAALPMEFRKAWSQLAPGPQKPELPNLAANSSPAQPSSRIFYPQAAVSDSIEASRHRLPTRTAAKPRRLSSNSPDAFEASVNSASYLEHPLEKILRWVDRILAWCEQRWQQWVERRTDVG